MATPQLVQDLIQMLLITARISRVATQHHGGPSGGQGFDTQTWRITPMPGPPVETRRVSSHRVVTGQRVSGSAGVLEEGDESGCEFGGCVFLDEVARTGDGLK